MEKTTVQKLKKAITGGLVGGANGIFGGGGGMIAVPLLARTGMTGKEAHATAILLILPISLLSFSVYAWQGLCDFSTLIPTALGVTAGGALGARLLGRLSERAVGLAFAALQLAAGIFMFFS